MLQGKVYDVTGNKMYQPGNSYNGKLPPGFFKWPPRAVVNTARPSMPSRQPVP